MESTTDKLQGCSSLSDLSVAPDANNQALPPEPSISFVLYITALFLALWSFLLRAIVWLCWPSTDFPTSEHLLMMFFSCFLSAWTSYLPRFTWNTTFFLKSFLTIQAGMTCSRLFKKKYFWFFKQIMHSQVSRAKNINRHAPKSPLPLHTVQGDGEGQGSLTCCSSRGRRESDTTQQLDNSNESPLYHCFCHPFFPIGWFFFCFHRYINKQTQV